MKNNKIGWKRREERIVDAENEEGEFWEHLDKYRSSVRPTKILSLAPMNWLNLK